MENEKSGDKVLGIRNQELCGKRVFMWCADFSPENNSSRRITFFEGRKSYLGS